MTNNYVLSYDEDLVLYRLLNHIVLYRVSLYFFSFSFFFFFFLLTIFLTKSTSDSTGIDHMIDDDNNDDSYQISDPHIPFK